MDDDRKKKLGRLETYSEDKDFAQYELATETTDALQQLVSLLANVGFAKIKGVKGDRGDDGDDGEDGVSVTGARLDLSGNLILFFSNKQRINVGRVVGDDGKSIRGDDGIGIRKARIERDDLIITLSDGRKVNAGRVRGEDGQDYTLTDEDKRHIALSMESQLLPRLESLEQHSEVSSITDLKEFKNLPSSGELYLVVDKNGLSTRVRDVHTASPGFFKKLKDTPNSYHGQGGKYVRVNSTEDGLEYASGTGGGGGSASIATETVTATTNGSGVDIDLTQLDEAWGTIQMVIRNGSVQDRSKWSINGDTLTLTGAVSSNSFQIMYSF